MKSTLFCLLKYFHSQVKSNLQNFTSRRWFYFYTQATVKPCKCLLKFCKWQLYCNCTLLVYYHDYLEHNQLHYWTVWSYLICGSTVNGNMVSPAEFPSSRLKMVSSSRTFERRCKAMCFEGGAGGGMRLDTPFTPFMVSNDFSTSGASVLFFAVTWPVISPGTFCVGKIHKKKRSQIYEYNDHAAFWDLHVHVHVQCTVYRCI